MFAVESPALVQMTHSTTRADILMHSFRFCREAHESGCRVAGPRLTVPVLQSCLSVFVSVHKFHPNLE